MPLPESSRPLTDVQYLESERADEFKSKFYRGETFANENLVPAPIQPPASR